VIQILDKNLIKSQIENKKLIELLQELGSSEPVYRQEALVFETVCHNCAGEGSHKLYYYPNTNLFRCYTNCGDSFDIFDLVIRQHRLRGTRLTIGQAIRWVYDRVDQSNMGFQIKEKLSEDWDILNRYKTIKEQTIAEKPILREYASEILNKLQFFIIEDWRLEGITIETMGRFGIKYNPISNAVIMPHYDEEDRLVGIRQRAMSKEDEDMYGKYRPAYINGQMYNHPLSYCVYGLSLNKDNISKIKKAIIFEGEKSVMLFDSFFGSDNNIAVACCGSNVSAVHIQNLIDAGAQEIVIAFDKEFRSIGDEGFNSQTRNLKSIYKKYSSKVVISFIFDKEDILEYKDSPIDKGKDSFIHLYKKRFTLAEGV
jgi:hypothetical protein